MWLPRWSQQAGRLHRPVEQNEFVFAVIRVTRLACGSTFVAIATPTVWLYRQIFYGFLGPLVLNDFVPHPATMPLRR